MRARLYRVSVGLYVLWLVAVVLFALGQYTAFPRVEWIRAGVVFGVAILALLGAGRFLRNGYRRLAG